MLAQLETDLGDWEQARHWYDQAVTRRQSLNLELGAKGPTQRLGPDRGYARINRATPNNLRRRTLRQLLVGRHVAPRSETEVQIPTTGVPP